MRTENEHVTIDSPREEAATVLRVVVKEELLDAGVGRLLTRVRDDVQPGYNRRGAVSKVMS